jgi:MFS family permease
MNTEDSGKQRRRVPLLRRTGPQFHLRPQRWNWVGVKRVLDDRILKQGEADVSPTHVVGMRYFWIDGVFASISDNILLSFLAVFLLAYGATNGQIGLLASIGNLFGVLALFPGAAHADRTLHPKRLVLWTGGVIGRAAIILFVVVPFVAPTAQAAIWAVILINAVRSFFGNYANPAWTSMVADLVPAKRRGKYFSDRNIAMGIAGMAALWAAGYLIPRLGGKLGLPFLGYQVVFMIALLFGAASTIAFSRIPTPSRAPLDVPHGGWNHLRRALKDHKEFGALLAGTFIWNFSVQAAGPFFTVFLIADLGGTAETVGLVAALTTLFGLAGSLVFGSQANRRGTLSVVRLTGLLIPIIPALWAVSTTVWHIYALSAITGFLWAGYNLGSFNLLLEFAPEEQRARGVALYQLVVFGSAVLGPAVGGILVDSLGYRGLFGLTAVGRLLGIVIFLYLIRAIKKSKQTG